ncbi:uncharacterized protein LOC121738745 [Aricia agestis]|uniref:uncharacterized protein LOC121738745 n=1 Tax=Aricia agestis TaxID=91739 RepID=UPI001C208D22|nr:uncharacterized protein LOC121738745 [Aricia agestis]
MWRWLLVWQTAVVLVGGTLDIRFFNSGRYSGGSQINCVDYPWQTDFSYTGWRAPRTAPLYATFKLRPTPATIDGITRRIDYLLANRDEIIKEHAKLVQDINSMRQVMYVAPLADENRDYDESIYHEIIETTSTTSRPTTPRPQKREHTQKNGIPVILLGGSSQKQHLVMSPPVRVKQSISLVGSSVTPLVRHPYPFVTTASTRHPVKICMASPATYTTTTKRPSFLERLIRSILPKYIG